MQNNQAKGSKMASSTSKTNKPVFSLTTDFRLNASPEQKAKRKEKREATIKRNKDNQKALGSWCNESRGKMNEIPVPKRRVS